MNVGMELAYREVARRREALLRATEELQEAEDALERLLTAVRPPQGFRRIPVETGDR